MASTAKDKLNRGTHVHYTGTANTRSISVSDFRKAGVEGDGVKAVSWDATTGHRVKSEDLSFLDDFDFDRIIASDPNFKIVEA